MNLFVLTGIVFAYSGLATNSYTMDRHYADINGRGAQPDARTRHRCRLLGWLGIVLSFAACVAAKGWHLGPVLWCGVLTLAALALTLLLQYAPRRAIQAGSAGYIAALLFGAASFI